jgi:hypothetical protein
VGNRVCQHNLGYMPISKDILQKSACSYSSGQVPFTDPLIGLSASNLCRSCKENMEDRIRIETAFMHSCCAKQGEKSCLLNHNNCDIILLLIGGQHTVSKNVEWESAKAQPLSLFNSCRRALNRVWHWRMQQSRHM